MWKVIVALFTGCLYYAANPVYAPSAEDAPGGAFLAVPTLINSVVFAVAAFCVLWLVMIVVKAWRRRVAIA
jgi:hypothetical protein